MDEVKKFVDFKMNENQNNEFLNIESFENDLVNSDNVSILSEVITINDVKYKRSAIKSDDDCKFVVYQDMNSKDDWFEIYFNINPFKFIRLEDYTI